MSPSDLKNTTPRPDQHRTEVEQPRRPVRSERLEHSTPQDAPVDEHESGSRPSTPLGERPSPFEAGLQSPRGQSLRPSLSRRSSDATSISSVQSEPDIMNEPAPALKGIHPDELEAFRADSRKLFRAAKHDGGLNITRRAGQMGVIPFYATTIAAGMTNVAGVIVGPLAGAAMLLGISLFASMFRNMRRSKFLQNSKTRAATEDFKERFEHMQKAVREFGGEDVLRADHPQFSKEWEEAKRLNAYLTFDDQGGWKAAFNNLASGINDTFSAFGGAHTRLLGGISKAVTGGHDVTEPLQKMSRAFTQAAEEHKALRNAARQEQEGPVSAEDEDEDEKVGDDAFDAERHLGDVPRRSPGFRPNMRAGWREVDAESLESDLLDFSEDEHGSESVAAPRPTPAPSTVSIIDTDDVSSTGRSTTFSRAAASKQHVDELEARVAGLKEIVETADEVGDQRLSKSKGNELRQAQMQLADAKRTLQSDRVFEADKAFRSGRSEG